MVKRRKITKRQRKRIETMLREEKLATKKILPQRLDAVDRKRESMMLFRQKLEQVERELHERLQKLLAIDKTTKLKQSMDKEKGAEKNSVTPVKETTTNGDDME